MAKKKSDRFSKSLTSSQKKRLIELRKLEAVQNLQKRELKQRGRKFYEGTRTGRVLSGFQGVAGRTRQSLRQSLLALKRQQSRGQLLKTSTGGLQYPNGTAATEGLGDEMNNSLRFGRGEILGSHRYARNIGSLHKQDLHRRMLNAKIVGMQMKDYADNPYGFKRRRFVK